MTLFCAIYGGLYYYAYQEEKNNDSNSNDKEKEKNYLFDDYTKYLLDETELFAKLYLNFLKEECLFIP